ncbi:efflux transporter outer membrane subunit [Spirabiliibacterium falconis]|uniref:efflux transporter outer membrane subunit n=1 Tax=Spirabiliibacterium falconis TaxID=572023 RepID=UPI001AADDAE2|nr:TolC family protein [Spirabiliibacterium falconis]MBE2894911.1 TolC family protein [Spirabiliibacterium falconis]
MPHSKCVFTALVLFLTACSQTQVPINSNIKLPAQFEQVKAGQAQNMQQWWQYWHDAQLASLIEQGLKNSPDIAIAQSRLNEARAIAQLAQSDLGPNVGIGGNIGGQRSQINNPIDEPYRTLLGQDDHINSKGYGANVGVMASWEVDIFGQKKSDSDAASAAARGAQARVYGSQMMLTTAIAENYLNAAYTLEQRSTLTAMATTLRKLQQYVKGRFEAGQVTAYEVSEVEAKLHAVQAQAMSLNAQFSAYERSIAVLIGQTPQAFQLDRRVLLGQHSLLNRLPLPPTGVQPSQLLDYRPDIQGKKAAVDAYAAKLASAKADLLPRFDIRFLGQGGRIELDGDLPTLKGIGGLVSVGVQLPLFTNGRIQANIDAADARLKTALLEYDQTLLRTLSEVESSYQLQYALIAQAQKLQSAVVLAKRQATQGNRLFSYGEKTLDHALRARLDALDLEQKMLELQLAKGQNLLNLYKAIGAGWQR